MKSLKAQHQTINNVVYLSQIFVWLANMNFDEFDISIQMDAKDGVPT